MIFPPPKFSSLGFDEDLGGVLLKSVRLIFKIIPLNRDENFGYTATQKFDENDLREEIDKLKRQQLEEAKKSGFGFFERKKASKLATEIFSKELKLKQFEFGKFNGVDTIIIVPGAGSTNGKSSEQAIERCISAYKKYHQLKKEGKTCGIIFSGGGTSGQGSQSEASIMFNELRTQSEESPIPLINMNIRLEIENLTTENQAMDTSESAQYSAVIVKALGDSVKDVIVITNSYHVSTVNQYFQKYFHDTGIKVETMSVEDVLKEESGNDIFEQEKLQPIKNTAINSAEERVRGYEKIKLIFNNLPDVVRQMVTYYMRGR